MFKLSKSWSAHRLSLIFMFSQAYGTCIAALAKTIHVLHVHWMCSSKKVACQTRTFQWGPSSRVQISNQRCYKPPTLALTENFLPFLVVTDPSSYQVGANLFQSTHVENDSHWVLVAFIESSPKEVLHHEEGVSGCGLGITNAPSLPARTSFYLSLWPSSSTMVIEHLRRLRETYALETQTI